VAPEVAALVAPDDAPEVAALVAPDDAPEVAPEVADPETVSEGRITSSDPISPEGSQNSLWQRSVSWWKVTINFFLKEKPASAVSVEATILLLTVTSISLSSSVLQKNSSSPSYSSRSIECYSIFTFVSISY